MTTLTKAFLCVCMVVLAFGPCVGIAQEPPNLDNAKQAVVRYHDSGEYEADIAKVINEAIHYLKLRIDGPMDWHKKKPAIVLDIDETSLSNYHFMQKLSFGGSLQQIKALENQATNPPIGPTLKLYQFAKKHHLAIFFITGRHQSSRSATMLNLKKAGFTHWDGLFFKTSLYKNKMIAACKTAWRKKITDKGYTIVANIGDQKSDLVGGYAEKTFLLPNPYYSIA